MRIIIKFSLVIFIICSICAFTLNKVSGQEMNSEQYKLQGGNFNSGTGTQSSSGYRLVDLIGQTSAQIFTSKGYTVRSGFLNRSAGSGLSFQIAPATVNFGMLTPGKEIVKNLLLTINSSDFPGYSVYVAQNMPLTTESGSQIPALKQDSPYGFGFAIKGNSVIKDLNTSGKFLPFADLSQKEKPVLIMESSGKKITHTANMLLKINVASSQPVGIYQNILNFSVLPGY